ncbi:MAG: primosomal protein N', partial [Thermodesulfobacteriota bacterium]
MIVVEAAVAAPLDTTLHYLVPEELAGEVAVGKRLLVPLGRRNVTAYCLDPAAAPPTGDFKLRPILDVLDAAPLFPAGMIPFFQWIARYYLVPLGEVIGEALPAGLIRQSGRRLLLTEAGRAGLPLPAEPPDWLADLVAKGELSAARTTRVLRRSRQLVARWRQEGFLDLAEELSRQRVTARTETCVCCPPADPGHDSLKPSEQKTLALIRQLADGVPGRTVPRRAITGRYPGAAAALRGLAAAGRVRLVEEPLFRDPFGLPPPFYPAPERLSGEQEEVLADVGPAIAKGGFAAFLLHGITGSGKTEVYLRAAAATLATGRSVLVLVPEIALATQLEAHFHSRFGARVALLHSGLSAGERYDQWRLIAGGEKQVVVGARSAIFAPLENPGLIIVDEEHDGAYKQEDGLRYHGRDLAVMRAHMQGAVVLLGSATPSLVSYRNAETGKYRLLRMTARVEDRSLPEVELVDLKTVPTVSGRAPIFSPRLTSALKENLVRGEQSLVFLNRRGFASMVLCQDCGTPVECRHCKVTLTKHKNAGQLVCHHCGYSVPAATVCSSCASGRLTSVGFGTERLEEELRRLLPAA